MTTAIHVAFPGVPPIITTLRQKFNDDWQAIGEAFADEIVDNRPSGCEPDQWVESLAAVVCHIDIRDPAASIAAVHGWLNAHYPDLMAMLDGGAAKIFADGVEGVL
jgi:hypothetical protein